MSGGSGRHLAFARLLSSAVVSQALLSAASFAVGLVLIRRTSDVQYGSYILVANAMLLAASLQNAFFGPPLAIRMGRLDAAGRSRLAATLYRAQRRVLNIAGAAWLLAAIGLWSGSWLGPHTGPLLLAALLAAAAILHREYFRMVLLAQRRPHDVLRADAVYVLLLVAGVFVATWTPVPAVSAVIALGLAAGASGFVLSRVLRGSDDWSHAEAPGILREIAPLATWSTAGAAIHWTFSQGTLYLVAGTLDVTAVAAIAATRLLLMPVNLLSTGIGSLMLPLASAWLHAHGPALLLRRLAGFALALAAVTLAYFALLWTGRDWVFDVLLKKQFAQRDTLLLLWGALFLVMVVRDQLVYLLAAQGRFRVMTSLTLMSALLSLAASYAAMRPFGVVGALAGMLAGELSSVIGIVFMSLRRVPAPAVVPA